MSAPLRIVQRLAAEEQHRADHHLRAACVMMCETSWGDRVVDDFGDFRLAHLAEVFANTVEHHHDSFTELAQHR